LADSGAGARGITDAYRLPSLSILASTIELCDFSQLHLCALLFRLLRSNESGTPVFEAYENVLERLLSEDASADLIPLALRRFEKRLLNALGYGLPLTHESVSGIPVEPDCYYAFDPLRGPRQVSNRTPGAIRGDSLWALANETFNSSQQLQEAKRITRVALRAQLGEKPLQSQRLWLTNQ
jgi:DNA repair protein RecO (recombination protein O)